MSRRVTFTIVAHFEPDLSDAGDGRTYWEHDLGGIREDCEDVVRGFGGKGVVIETVEEQRS